LRVAPVVVEAIFVEPPAGDGVTATTVNAGALIVNGSIAPSSLTTVIAAPH
jgi:hypothetical protein